MAVWPGQAEQLLLVGQHIDVIAGDPGRLAAAEIGIPDAPARAWRSRAAMVPLWLMAMTQLAIDDRPAADIGEVAMAPVRAWPARFSLHRVRPESARSAKISPEL